MKNIKNKKGFTLIELIVVLAILGILMLILVPSFLGYANDAKQQVAKANTRTVYTAYKAAETKQAYGGIADGAEALKTEIETKLGSASFAVTITDATHVSVVTNGLTCTFNPTTSFDNAQNCEKK